MKTRWHPEIVLEAARKAGLYFVVHDGWDKLAPYGDRAGWTSTQSAPVGVVWHHTACGSRSTSDHPSLQYVRFPGQYAGQARACNLLIDRRGVLHFVGAHAQYHAGSGGPVRVAGRPVGKDLGNRYLYGIEIEASNSDRIRRYKQGDMRGLTRDQWNSTVAFTAALATLMGWSEHTQIRHRDWTDGGFDGNPTLPTRGRKIDIQLPLRKIRRAVRRKIISYGPVLNTPEPPQPEPGAPLWDGVTPNYWNVRKAELDPRTKASLAAYRVATRLYDLGHYTGKPPVKYKQRYPKRAVRAFQKAVGVTPGVYTKTTHTKLFPEG